MGFRHMILELQIIINDNVMTLINVRLDLRTLINAYTFPYKIVTKFIKQIFILSIKMIFVIHSKFCINDF